MSTLPLSAEAVERTRLPLERATQLPGAAFTDPGGAASGSSRSCSSGGWICAGHVDQVRERGEFLMVEIGGESVFVVGDDDGPPARVPEHLPPPRRAARRRARGRRAAPAVPVPRVDLRLRRHARERAVHRRARGLRARLLRAQAGPPRGRRGAGAARPVRRGAAARTSTSATSPTHLARYRTGELQARRADRLRRRRQLEGDRRELQRVPALPGRAPGAQPALALPLRRDDHGRGRVVRRLDDARRGRRDDGGRRRHGARPPIEGAHRGRSRASCTSCCSPTRWSRCTPTT